jgi:hypothetical protein
MYGIGRMVIPFERCNGGVEKVKEMDQNRTRRGEKRKMSLEIPRRLYKLSSTNPLSYNSMSYKTIE